MSAAAGSSEDLNSNKRQRVSRACDLCRKKKIKCDGGIPVCGNCQAFNYECSYNDMTKKRGPPKGYIEAVENRLEKLERILEDIAKDKNDQRLIAELNAPLETPTGEIIKSRPVRRHQRTDGLKKRRLGGGADEGRSRQSPMSLSQICFADSPPSGHLSYPDSMPSSPDSAEDSTGQLSMDENGQVRYLGKSSGYYLLQGSRTYQNGAFHFTGYNHKVTSKKKPTDLDPLELPPKDLSEHLLKLYFENFYPFLPLFYKRRLTSSMDSALEPVSPLLLNAIYAVASRISPDVRVRSDPASADTAGDIFVERAKYLLDSYYDIPRISTVQALLLLASHQHGTMNFVRGWMYSGMAFRMAQDLGLHRNCDHWNIPKDECERRKRVFWCCFIVDRLISAIYGRSSTFEERDCDVPFPSVDDDEIEPGKPDPDNPPRPKVLETFIHLTKISDILGHVLRNIYYAKARHHGSPQHLEHVLNGLNRELTNWYSNLPPSLQYKLPDTESGETARDPPLPISQIHMLYYTTVILLHRPFIPGPSHPAPPTSLPSYKICISAAKSILDIVNVMLSEDHLKYVYNYAVYCVFTAGIVFIKMASSDEPDKTFDAKIFINKIMRALDEIEGTWMNAARCCNILGELAGLREIDLECTGYVPRRMSKVANPPPSIAVPNSPEKESSSTFNEEQQEQQQRGTWEEDTNAFAQSNNRPAYTAQSMTSATVDPFAAPGVVPSSQQQYDPFHTAFWGVPPSLDMEEWTKYFGTQNNQDTPIQGPPILPSSAQPLIPSHEFSPMQGTARQNADTITNDTIRRGDGGLARPLVHNDQNVDMLSGVSLPLNLPDTPAGSVLLGFLASQERVNNQQSNNSPSSS